MQDRSEQRRQQEVGTSWPRSARKLETPMPATPRLNHRWPAISPASGSAAIVAYHTIWRISGSQSAGRISSVPPAGIGQGQDHRVINVQLATVPGGQSRCLTGTRTSWSDGFSGRITKFPKLIVRVRFPSPAPITSMQVGMAGATAGHELVIIVESVACH
jgi:hypothetical protein